MEARSGSIKDPIYYPSGIEALGADQAANTSTRGSGGSQELELDESVSLKVPRKFITNWRQACDRTRDRTKDLLKRWRTIPANTEELAVTTVSSATTKELTEHPNWSVHVWTTWVSRYPGDNNLLAIEEFDNSNNYASLAPIQRDKFSHFFNHLLDHDKDGYICRKDFAMLSERLRRFADWSWNSPEYLRLVEIERCFAEMVLQDKEGKVDPDRKIDLDDWLLCWAQIVAPPNGVSYNELPFWIKTLPRTLFNVMNTSGDGRITKKEIANFYGCVIGMDFTKICKCLDIAYDSMTSNGDYPLRWQQYQLVFANFLFGRGPFGPGEHFLGMSDTCLVRGNSIQFPIDYSAMNTPKDRLELYSPHCKSTRRSIIV